MMFQRQTGDTGCPLSLGMIPLSKPAVIAQLDTFRRKLMLGTKQRLSNALLTSTACLTAVGLVLATTAATQARVTRIAIEKKVSPAFDGASFGGAGQYETLAGKAFGELDPNDPHNAVIQDIK